MLQDKYYFSKKEDVISSIRRSELEFHKSHIPFYANYLFCNSLMMYKIGDNLVNNSPLGITLYTLIDEIDIHEKLNNNAFTCGMELINGKVDFETNYEIAKYSQNVFISGFESIFDDDFLMLVLDDSLSDNVFILKYIPNNNDDGDDTETVYSPDEKRICTLL